MPAILKFPLRMVCKICGLSLVWSINYPDRHYCSKCKVYPAMK